MLALSGWRTIDVHRGDSLAALWPQAGRCERRGTGGDGRRGHGRGGGRGIGRAVRTRHERPAAPDRVRRTRDGDDIDRAAHGLSRAAAGSCRCSGAIVIVVGELRAGPILAATVGARADRGRARDPLLADAAVLPIQGAPRVHPGPARIATPVPHRATRFQPDPEAAHAGPDPPRAAPAHRGRRRCGRARRRPDDGDPAPRGVERAATARVCSRSARPPGTTASG